MLLTGIILLLIPVVATVFSVLLLGEALQLGYWRVAYWSLAGVAVENGRGPCPSPKAPPTTPIGPIRVLHSHDIITQV
jgi:hypothetical protein